MIKEQPGSPSRDVAHGVGWAGVERGEPEVEVAGGVGFAVDEHGSDADDVGGCRDAVEVLRPDAP